jgi:hypothetical protein
LAKDDGVLSNVRVDGTLTVTGDGVVVRNVNVDGPIIVLGNSVTIDHVTAESVVGTGASDLTVRRSNLSGGGTAVHITSDRGSDRYIRNVKLLSNYIHDPSPGERESYSGTHLRGANGVTISCSNYALGGYGNAAIFMEDTNGGTSDVNVTNNWLNGGGSTVSTDARNVTVEGNVFGTAYTGDLCRTIGQQIWQDQNVMEDGTPVRPCADGQPDPSSAPQPGEVTPTPTTPEPSPTPTAEPSPTPTAEPSPTPTAEPSPTPTVSNNPPTSASSCTKPSAASTGASGSRVRTSTTVLNSGQTLENADISTLEIRGSGVTVRNVKVDGRILVTGDDVMIDHVTAQHVGISSASNVTVQYSDIGYSPEDGIHVTSDGGSMVSNVIIRHNWIHDPRAPAEAHYDGLQVRGINGLVADCNLFDAGPFQDTMNAGIYLENDNGGNSNVRVSNNWIYGHAFPIMVGPGRSIVLKDNRIGGDIKWGPCYPQDGLNQSELTSTGNVWDATGEALDLCR